MDPITISAALSPAGRLALNSANDEDEALPSRPPAIGNRIPSRGLRLVHLTAIDSDDQFPFGPTTNPFDRPSPNPVERGLFSLTSTFFIYLTRPKSPLLGLNAMYTTLSHQNSSCPLAYHHTATEREARSVQEALASGCITIARPGGILYRMLIHLVDPLSLTSVAGPEAGNRLR
ncbi:Uncharacterized protein Adt_27270 [Abeliophyllum distichum]|uniref:Uncharacterized protein n=1 Tax=Abeliophyllum distichum TaxID=126358 RepID=A0ABD1RTA4_9LAMI